MSAENVEKAKAFYPAERLEVAAVFQRDDAVELLESSFGHLFHSDFETLAPESSVIPSGVGMNGFVEGWRDWLAPWQSWEAAGEDYIDVGDKVLVLIDVVARAKADQTEVPQSMAAVLTFRDGLIARIELYLNRRRALEDVGVEP